MPLRNFNRLKIFLGKYLGNILFVRSTCKQQDKKVDQGYRTNCGQNEQVSRIRVRKTLFDCSKINGVRCDKEFSAKRCQVVTEAFQVRTVRFVAHLLVDKIVITTKKTISANTFEKDKTSLIDHYAMCNETWKLNVKEISSVTPAYILDSCDISFNMCVFAPFCSVCGNSKHEKRTKLEI